MKRNNLDRKAQIRMTETIAVLIIFFILVVFGIVFYYRYQHIALKEKADELLAARAMDTVIKTLFLPELTCTKGEAEAEDNCFDLMKVRSANNTFLQYRDEYYYDLLGYTTVTVRQVYPEEQNFTLYNKTKPDWSKKEPTYFVVSLRDDLRGVQNTAYGLGYLVVEVYS